MKKIIGLLLVMALICTGCAGGKTSSEERMETGMAEDGVLRLYTLEDQPSLHEEILKFFEAKYPEYKVRVEVGVSEEDGITLSDAIRNLNAEMMAGNGPDILLLDGLPIQDYIEKGLLSDLNDILEVLKSEEEQYFENVLSAYAKDGKICAIPSAFSVPVVVGDEEAVNQGTIHNLTELIVERKEDSLPVINKYFMEALPFLLLVSWSEVFPDSRKADEEALSVLLKDMKQLADISGFDKDLPEYENWSPLEVNSVIWDDFELLIMQFIGSNEVQLRIGTLNGNSDFIDIKSIRRVRPLSYEYLNRENGMKFLPKHIIGINASSKMQKEAKLFVKYFLEARVIKREDTRNNWMSVNRNALEERLQVSKEEKNIYQNLVEFNTDPGKIWEYTLLPQEAQEFIEFVDQADTMIDVDFNLFQTVMSLVQDYIYEENTLDNVVSEIVNRVEIYQAE